MPATATATSPPAGTAGRERSGAYKWIALTNTTIGILMATIDASIVLISLPAIFRGIHINPLTSTNTSYLLWMLMGYMVITAVLVVTFGRVGDMFGRVKMYNLGFAIFTAGSLAASLTYFGGSGAALYLIAMRVVQGVGGAMIMANSTAILTDAFPENERGMALGINSVAGIAGSFIGLVAGGLLATVDWHLIFYVSVPIGLFGTVWGYRKLQEISVKEGGKLDLPGNVLFGVGLVALLVGITYALQPYGGSTMGWLNPMVLALLAGGGAMLVAFVVVESRIAEPMFDMRLFKIRAFAAGNFASLLASIGRGGLMFMLIIWLQGIWLPLHGYNFVDTPLWAGIYMLPLTAGFLVAGPASGYLSDHFGARPFATGGMIAAAATFALLMLLPVNFGYVWFALLLLANGLAMGLFAAPNTAGIMNAVPANRRGAASGMRSTFQNAGMTLSIGLFFTIMVVGLSSTLPAHLTRGLTAQGVPAAAAAKVAGLPPVSILFAAFLGYNPMKTLLGPTLAHLSPAHQKVLEGHTFFSNLIAGPFHHGLTIVFTFALVMCAVAAAASWLRGKSGTAAAAAAARAVGAAAGAGTTAGAAAIGSGATTVAGTAGNEAAQVAAGTGAAEAAGAPRPAPAAAASETGTTMTPASGTGPTAGPTTAGPTTAGPTTAGPTTAGPTTAGPTTAGPTTAGPTTPSPGTAAPGTAAPAAGPVRVVTISASFGAGGAEVGRAVAERLGLPFVDRLIPREVAGRLGVAHESAMAHDERVQSELVRSLIELVGAPVSFGPSGLETGPVDDEDAYRAATEAVLAEVADTTGGVILGRGAMLVLAGRPDVLHVRLDGDADARVRRAMEATGADEPTAYAELRRTDHARRAYLRHLYGADPADPHLYHLVLDTSAVPLAAAVDAIVAAATAVPSTSGTAVG